MASESFSDAQMQPTLDALQALKLPYCADVVPLDKKFLMLFYGTDDGFGGRVDFSDSAEAGLRMTRSQASAKNRSTQLLTDAFKRLSVNGSGNADSKNTPSKMMVLDESCVAPKLNLADVGILNNIRYSLLEGEDATQPVYAKLRAMNIIEKNDSPGSKAYKIEKGKAKDALGSLLVFYPTSFQGGTMVFKYAKNNVDGNDANNAEYSFDAGEAISGARTPCVAYAAYLHDGLHELELAPLQDGYAAFLVYDLYLFSNKPSNARPPRSASLRTKSSDEVAILKRSLMTLVKEAAKTFPNGRGFLGFGLVHRYLSARPYESEVKLLPEELKGRDALLYTSFRDLGLDVQVTGHFVDDSDDDAYLEALANAIKFSNMATEDTLHRSFKKGEAICVGAPDDYYGDEGDPEVFKLVWVTQPNNLNVLRCQYIRYYGGNDDMMLDMRGRACLVVKIHKS